MTKIVNVAKMFRTIEQRASWMAEHGLSIDENGNITDGDECLYNPWCFEYEHKGKWISVVGIAIEYGDALRRICELKQNNPGTKFRMYRANDLELFTLTTE